MRFLQFWFCLWQIIQFGWRDSVGSLVSLSHGSGETVGSQSVAIPGASWSYIFGHHFFGGPGGGGGMSKDCIPDASSP